MKSLSLVFGCLLLAVSVFATEIPAGNVSGVWTAAEGPYLIQGNIRVAPGESLVIEAGTEVVFQGSYLLRIRGNFSANGAPADSVRFSWAFGSTGVSGIYLDSLDAASDTARFNHFVMAGPPTSRIRIINADKVVIEHSRISGFSNFFAGAVYIAVSTGVVIRHTTFSNHTVANSSYGGAIYLADCSPLIEHCTFVNNSGNQSGGAISMWRQNLPTQPIIRYNHFEGNTAATGAALDIRSNVVPTIYGNTFVNNVASVSGGAVWIGYVQADTVAFSYNLFEGNSCPQRGGAIRSINSKVSFNGDRFVGNTSSQIGGGGLHANDNNLIVLNNCEFSGNSGVLGGGISFDDEATVTASRCVFANNTATVGGAFMAQFNINGSFTNCLFANNEATSAGGAFRLVQFSDLVFTHCTFAMNAAPTGGAASLYWDSDPVFNNTVWFGNEATTGSNLAVQDYIQNYCEPVFNHALVGESPGIELGTSSYGGYTGFIDGNPEFVAESAVAGAGGDGLSADFRLSPGSPAVDAGTTVGVNMPTVDLDGALRVVGSVPDLGCYEFDPLANLNPIDFNADGTVDVDDFLLFLADYGCSAAPCIGDLNGDGITGTADLLLFLVEWGG